jgi:hypothetical protein
MMIDEGGKTKKSPNESAHDTLPSGIIINVGLLPIDLPPSYACRSSSNTIIQERIPFLLRRNRPIFSGVCDIAFIIFCGRFTNSRWNNKGTCLFYKGM